MIKGAILFGWLPNTVLLGGRKGQKHEEYSKQIVGDHVSSHGHNDVFDASLCR